MRLTKLSILTFAALLTTSSIWAQEQPREWALQNYEQYTAEAAAATPDQEKAASIEYLRAEFHKHGFRKSQYNNVKVSLDEALRLLQDDGTFSDLEPLMQKHLVHADGQSREDRTVLENTETEIWYRLGIMADAVATGKADFNDIYTPKYLKSIIYYTELEIGRDNYVPRFHFSCFSLPTSAMNIYYAFMNRMEAVENNEPHVELEATACKMLKTLALQAWTQPLRKDATDNDVSSVDRFRHHVWWVGGNGLAYRSLLPIACMIRSTPMVDVLAEVAQGGISSTSQTTNETSFWSEGFTADGAGWGHGMQCLIWGYPIDGTAAALNMLSSFRGTVWERKLNEENREAILNYLQGSNWYYYKGYNLPCLDRTSFKYKSGGETIKAMSLIKTIFEDWIDSFTKEEQAELALYKEQSEKMLFSMPGYADGVYNGTRYFFNNDDLIKKNNDYHLIVNMASYRCDGIESFPMKADGYNFTTCDGMTLFQKSGNEYMQIYGAYDPLRAPGVTARQGMERLTPVTNWNGYSSKHNYAAAATMGGENAVAGYVFEKIDGNDKKEGSERYGDGLNSVIYGVQAHKSYFIFGDYMLALGSGITNLEPEQEGDIHTSIEQTDASNKIYTLKGRRKRRVKSGVHKLSSDEKSLEWLMQSGKFAYAPLPDYSDNTYYTVEQRKQDWVKMNILNKNSKNAPKEANVLQMWTDHGHAPKNDTYGYVVYMGKGNPARTLPFSVVRNDMKVQAAASNDGKIIEAVFYDTHDPIEVVGNRISVSEPCALLLEKHNGGWRVSLTDAQMRADLKAISLKINNRNYQIAMPQGKYCGKPAVVNIK